MTGFLVKDFLYLKQHAKFFLILVVFYTVLFSSFQGEGVASFLTALIVVLGTTLVLNSFAYDELAKWDRFAFSLPVPRSQAVLGKYLFTLILAAGFSVFGLIAMVAAKKGSLQEDDWITIYVSFCVSVILPSVLIPLIYRFGLQKARVAMLILFLVPFGGVYLIQKINPGLFSGGMPGEAQILFWLKLSPLFLLVIFGGSFLISCGILQKKEV